MVPATTDTGSTFDVTPVPVVIPEETGAPVDVVELAPPDILFVTEDIKLAVLVDVPPDDVVPEGVLLSFGGFEVDDTSEPVVVFEVAPADEPAFTEAACKRSSTIDCALSIYL